MNEIIGILIATMHEANRENLLLFHVLIIYSIDSTTKLKYMEIVPFFYKNESDDLFRSHF